MKRTAEDSLPGLAPPEKRSRRDAAPEQAGPDLLPTVDAFDAESPYTRGASILSGGTPAETPITPFSPPRKWPSDLKTIKCTHPGCDKTFNRPARLAAHLRSHNDERPFTCPYPDCNKDYREEKHLKQHIKGSHTDERDHVCPHEGCGKQFMTATRLRRHQQVHEGQERYRCRDFPPCNQTFRKHQTLQRHIRTEHQNQPGFACDHKVDGSGGVCGQGFDSAAALRRHQERDHGENRYWCDECANQVDGTGNPRRTGFPTLALLQAHMKQEHVRCMFCAEPCDGREDLDAHVESEHTAPKTVEERKTVACTWPGCTKTFTRTSNLNVHIRSAHEGVRFICGQFDLSKTADLATWSNAQGCGQAFNLKVTLENHVRYVHLMLPRPEPKNRPRSRRRSDAPPMLEQLAGVGAHSRRTLPCTFEGCHQKFTYSGELEAHIQREHGIEQALLESVGLPVPTLAPSPVVDGANQGMMAQVAYGTYPQGMALQGANPSGMVPQGANTLGMAPQGGNIGMAPQGASPQGFDTQGVSPYGVETQGLDTNTQGVVPIEMPTQGVDNQGMPGPDAPWDPEYNPDTFWVGDVPNLGDINSIYPPLDEEWLHDEAEMRRLIEPNDSTAMLDPSLRPPQQ